MRKMHYLKGPWKCSICGRIYESLDEAAEGKGIPGYDPVFICNECKTSIDYENKN